MLEMVTRMYDIELVSISEPLGLKSWVGAFEHYARELVEGRHGS